MQTQYSSKARVKKDTVGDAGLTFLFEQYRIQPLDLFRVQCTQLIEASTGKRETKDLFIREIGKANSKDMMLKKVTNYLLAGQGLGV